MKPSIYTRPQKPKMMQVKKRGAEYLAPSFESLPEVLEVGPGTECHVTPQTVAARMVQYLALSENCTVLEPSVGTGNLYQALIDSGFSSRFIYTIELNNQLSTNFLKRFIKENTNHIQGCFLEYAPKTKQKFNRIIMNPPFKNIKQHIKAAESLLSDDSILIALVPITYQNDKAETLETLDSSTFASTKVNTKIIRIKGG